MRYVKLAKTTDFSKTSLKSFSIMGKRLSIIKRKDGSFYAIEIGCKHQGADLSAGVRDGSVVTCPRHGWRYDLETGECENHDSPKLRRHDLLIEGETIKVALTPVE